MKTYQVKFKYESDACYKVYEAEDLEELGDLVLRDNLKMPDPRYSAYVQYNLVVREIDNDSGNPGESFHYLYEVEFTSTSQ